jgi:hypothetical protein
MAIKTQKRIERENRNKKIIALFNKLNINGSDKMAVCELVAKKLNFKASLVYRVVNS